MSEPLHLKWHLGLGDAMLCNGLVRTLNETFKEIILPSWAHNVQTIRKMFADLEGVTVTPVDFDGMIAFGEGKRVMKLGHYENHPSTFDAKKFDQEFYRQAGVPFEHRWTKCKVKVPEEYWMYPNFGEPYAFVHQDLERGFKIDVEKAEPTIIIEPDKRESFFKNIGLLQGAKEVHCINSSLLILCDSLPPVEGQKLFLHHYARKTDYPTLKKNWVVLGN